MVDVRDQCLANKVCCCFVFVSKVSEIGRISVVMYVSDHFVSGKLQLTLNGVSVCVPAYFISGVFPISVYVAYSVNAPCFP